MASKNIFRKISFGNNNSCLNKQLSSKIAKKAPNKKQETFKPLIEASNAPKEQHLPLPDYTQNPTNNNSISSPTPLLHPTAGLVLQKFSNRTLGRPQISPLVRPIHQRSNRQPETETEMAKKNVELQHLQPSMLPEFFKPNVDFDSATYRGHENTQGSSSQYRHFEISKTHKSLTRPLKPPRLANPFPDPVKIMPSDTVSDREKAEQMLAEAKCSRR